MTFVGMPCVFYGDEKGMTGVLEEEYRRPMPWTAPESEKEAFYRKAIWLRRQHTALCRGTFRAIDAQSNGGIYHYKRETEDETIGVMLNRSETSAYVDVPGEILWQEQLKCDILGAYGFVIYRQE